MLIKSNKELNNKWNFLRTKYFSWRSLKRITSIKNIYCYKIFFGKIRGESYTNQGSMVDFLNKTGEYDAYFEKK